jgi:hypothetical protein
MSCLCPTLGEIEKVENHIAFFESLPVLEVGNWVKLCQCPTCSQLWSVDEWDKGNISFARKKSSKSNWEEADVEAQKRYLLKSRGIQEGITCMQSGCQKPALKGVVYCVDHLYNMGWRE